MVQGYYQSRGWDESGSIPEEKLQELEIPAGQGKVSGLASRVLG